MAGRCLDQVAEMVLASVTLERWSCAFVMKAELAFCVAGLSTQRSGTKKGQATEGVASSPPSEVAVPCVVLLLIQFRQGQNKRIIWSTGREQALSSHESGSQNFC